MVNMKGITEEMIYTLLIVLAVLFFAALAIIAAICLVLPVNIPGTPCGNKGQISGTASLTELYNKPHLIAAALSEYKIDDRKFLEHVLEIAVTEDTDANANFEPRLRSLFKEYDFRYYSVKIEKDKKVILEFDSIPDRCGQNREGFCFTRTSDELPCDVGKVEIKTGDNGCGGGDLTVSVGGDTSFMYPRIHKSPSKSCCVYVSDKEYTEQAKKNTDDPPKIVHCGDYGKGVCSINECDEEASYELPDNTCKDKDVNNKQTPYCCAPRSPEVLGSVGEAYSAYAPIYYKGEMAQLTITIGD